jgi:hypothetical protein
MIRSALGCPTRSRALALTAFTAENFFAFFLTIPDLLVSARSFLLQHQYEILSRSIPGVFAMEERDFFTEQNEQRTHTLTCPHCGKAEEYQLAWLVRRKRNALPRHADERDRARFAKAQSYMVRKDDMVACKNIRCRKRFDVAGVQSVAFLESA